MNILIFRKDTNREGADRGSRELGKFKMLGLDILANGEGALAIELVGGDSSNPLADGVIRVLLKLATLGNRHPISLEGGRDLGVLRAREGSRDDGNLLGLFSGEGEPVPLLLGQLLLRSKSNWGVKE